LTPDPDEVRERVRAEYGSSTFLEGLASRVGSLVKPSVAFGDPVEKGPVTVIPVAKAWFGFGGGSGDDEESRGSGGGGGGVVRPLGYIEVSESGAEFRPLRDPWLIPGALAGVAVLAVLLIAQRQGSDWSIRRATRQ
jgi:uncharacterized spore protein YtfJ